MTHTLRLVCLVVLLTSPILASPDAPAYSVIGLEGLTPGFGSRAFAINNRTQIVGWSLLVGPPVTFDFKAVLWHADQITDLGALPGGTESTATGINNRGQVVLYSEAINCRSLCNRAALWEHGTLTDLGATGRPASPNDINDRGQVVGTLATPPNHDFRIAVLRQNGTAIRLPTLRPNGQAQAFDINDLGEIVGDSGGQAVLWVARER